MLIVYDIPYKFVTICLSLCTSHGSVKKTKPALYLIVEIYNSGLTWLLEEMREGNLGKLASMGSLSLTLKPVRTWNWELVE